MSHGAGLAESLVEVRDVVETVRGYDLLPPDWQISLATAIDQLSRLPRATAERADINWLVRSLRILAAGDPRGNLALVTVVADHVAALLRIEMPLPDPADWAFPHSA
jgi:hypothetical protein